MKIFKSVIIASVFLLLFIKPLYAKILKVPDDYSSIQDAIYHSEDGDTLYVYPGTYYEAIRIDRDINLFGSGPDVTTIIGPGPSLQNNGATIFIDGMYSGSIRNFKIEGSRYGIRSSMADDAYASRPYITNNIITDNYIFGIGLDGNDSPYTYNNAIVDNNRYLEFVDPSTGQAVLPGSVTDASWGIAHSSGTLLYTITTDIRNNIVTGHTVGVHDGGHPGITLDYNDVWHNGRELPWGFFDWNYAGVNPGPHDISVDPKFIDPDSEDYRLRSYSLAKDAGDPNPSFNDTDGTRNDMGAYGGPYAKFTPPQSDHPQNLQQPQIGESRLENLSNNPPDHYKPTIVITHGTDSNISDWADDMGREIASHHPEYNVFGWDWSKYAIGKVHPNPFKPMGWETILSIADKEGEKLADHLEYWDYTNSVHFIGHSAGGTLIQRAATDLENNGIQVEQLTFLDAPRLAAFRDANFVDWADNYRSEWGSIWDGAYKYELATHTHSYAHEYYYKTILGPYDNNIPSTYDDEGFYWSKAGGGWNEKPDRDDSGKETPQTTSPLPLMSTTKMKDDFSNVGVWNSYGNVTLINGMAFLKEASPAYLFEDLTIPFDANFLDFDFMFANTGDGDYLTTHFNENLLFWFEGTNFYGNDFWNSGLIDINPYAGQTGTLTFTLNSVGNPNADLWIDNLEFSRVQPVPESSSLFLLSIGLLGVANIIIKRKI